MLHRMVATFCPASKRNLSSHADSDPFLDGEFEIMYNMTVRAVSHTVRCMCFCFLTYVGRLPNGVIVHFVMDFMTSSIIGGLLTLLVC
jgi:hypothetical protein